jgi:hypothetical protein
MNIVDQGIIRRGRPYNLVIRERILRILKELLIATPQWIKDKYETDFNVPISWGTVHNRLSELVKESKVFETVITPGQNLKGKIRMRINKIYCFKPLVQNISV